MVIADEPTPGLDLKTAKRVMEHFRDMADMGAGVLLITHDLRLAAETADRIVVFYDGEVIDEVRPEAFKRGYIEESIYKSTVESNAEKWICI